MKKNLIIFLIACFCLSLSSIWAQQKEVAKNEPVSEAYDPLIPQLFAFDKESQIFAGINKVDNTIDIIEYKDGKLVGADVTGKKVVVDVVVKRHDVHHIYRPKSVAIYDGYIVFLASHRDSCYLEVLTLEGKSVGHHVFAGGASAFSYSPESKELYIAGEHAEGYDIAALSVANGFDAISMDNSDLSLHYKRLRKAETISLKDKYGFGMAITAMSVVFLSLILLYLAFKNVGNLLISIQDRRERKAENLTAQTNSKPISTAVTNPEEISGETYAAISAAIYMYNSELHDEENTVITIAKVSRNYSPWSSKLYGLNTYFNNRR